MLVLSEKQTKKKLSETRQEKHWCRKEKKSVQEQRRRRRAVTQQGLEDRQQRERGMRGWRADPVQCACNVFVQRQYDRGNLHRYSTLLNTQNPLLHQPLIQSPICKSFTQQPAWNSKPHTRRWLSFPLSPAIFEDIWKISWFPDFFFVCLFGCCFCLVFFWSLPKALRESQHCQMYRCLLCWWDFLKCANHTNYRMINYRIFQYFEQFKSIQKYKRFLDIHIAQ